LENKGEIFEKQENRREYFREVGSLDFSVEIINGFV
jgi:hypothetical protein